MQWLLLKGTSANILCAGLLACYDNFISFLLARNTQQVVIS